MPDSVLAPSGGEGQLLNTIDPSAIDKMEQDPLSSTLSSKPVTDGVSTSLRQIGDSRQKLQSIELDKASERVKLGTETSLDKIGYMTDLDSMVHNSETQINDIKKARALLKSVIKSKPESTSGWIALARIEELDGKIKEARNILD